MAMLELLGCFDESVLASVEVGEHHEERSRLCIDRSDADCSLENSAWALGVTSNIFASVDVDDMDLVLICCARLGRRFRL